MTQMRIAALTYVTTFSTCPNSSSTGVDRPKIVTITFNVSRSSLTSSTTPGKAGERPFGDAHRLVLLELDLELRLVLGFAHAIHDVLDFFFRQRRGLLARADESGHARRGLHHVPDVVIHVHLHQHVAGIEHALAGVLLAAANFGDRLRSESAPGRSCPAARRPARATPATPSPCARIPNRSG